MIPTGSTLKNAPVQNVQQTSRTWRLDFEAGRVTGMIDNLDAVQQAVIKILQTDRFAQLIYSFNYGNELNRLIGMSPLFVQSEATRIIQEALSVDDRIRGVQDVTVSIEGDSMTITFTVITQYGSFQASWEVTR
ncbi:DUF2634 domain-containing protein [Paenibacillus sp. GYB004]|uniref:DUF2634 domain-containing protein n=1 Tax=Paenibacillus sp. GYB004 TaxID=2994393 RepID=UPI002F96AD3C